MSFSFPEIRKFAGLYLQANSFTVPDGAMEEAHNVIVKNDDTVQKVKGNYTYFDPGVSVLNQLFFYKNKLLAAFASKIGYFTDTGVSPNETGSYSNLSGETVSITAPRVSRSVEASSNLYFTTDNGVLKLEDYNSSIFKSGVPPGLDLSLTILPSSSGYLAANRSVGYRVVFGRLDANNNLLLSAPSNIATVFGGAGATGVSYTSTGAGPYTVTVTSPSHGLITGQFIITSNSADPDANGTFQITVTSANTFTFSTAGDPGAHTLDYTFTRQIRLELSIPSEITSSSLGYFYQVYRSSQITGNSTPALDYQLVTQNTLTSTEITNGVAFFNDNVDDILLGAELYTNPNTQEGELQSNFKAPLCNDVVFYKNYTLYANCTSRRNLEIDLIDTSDLADNDYIEFTYTTLTRRYVALTGVGNSTVGSQSITSSSGLVINYTAHNFSNNDRVYISNISGGTLTEGIYYVISAAANSFKISTSYGGSAVAFNSETSLDFQGVIRPTVATGKAWTRTSGVVTVTSVAHDLTTGMIIQVAASAGGSPNVTLANYGITVTGVDTFTFAESAANSSGTLEYRANNYLFKLDKTSSSFAVELTTTAQGIVKAVNRDSSGFLYASYISIDVPGQMRFMSKGFISTIYARAKSTTVAADFLPALPTSFSTGTQVGSQNDNEQNVIYVSKISEPEAVPLVNFFPVGSRAKQILRIISLRDSVIIIKEDGVFRLTGDVIDNFTITILDSTIVCVADSSVKLLNNEVIFLSNQGVCRVSESAVEIVSRKIDDVIQPILGKSNISTQTAGVAYESERLYFITTMKPNSTSADETYVFNILNGSWTQNTSLIIQGIIGPADTMYFISTSNKIQKERKKQTKIDLSGQNYTITVSTVSSNMLSCVISSPSVTPEEGDMIVKEDLISRAASVTALGGTLYTITFSEETNLAASDSEQLYKRIVSVMKFSPFHAGEVGRMKQFSELIMHSRDNSFSKATISFANYLLPSSEEVVWKLSNIFNTDSLGWGLEPWGLFPWGDAESIDTVVGTQPQPPARTYIPRLAQRTTFIQTMITHQEAGESINLQALSFAVRAYFERVVR